MLIVVQFPFADLRAFLDTDDDTRIPISTSFSKKDLAQTRGYGGTRPAPFLRGVGPLRQRRQGIPYAGESLYFNGRHTVVFADAFRTIPDPRDGTALGASVFFRRFQAYREDHQLAKYELGIVIDLGARAPLDGSAMRELLASCLAILVSVPPSPGPVPLVTAGPQLATGLLRDTTLLRSPVPPEWTLAAGMPAVLVEYGSSELTEPPAGARIVGVEDAEQLRLAVSGFTVARVPVTAWFLSTGAEAVSREWFKNDAGANARDLARQLRINLLRHHAEREALAYTLQCVRDRKVTMSGPGLAHAELRDYLVRAASRLTRSQRFGVAQAPINTGIADMEVAAGFVDRADMSRYSESWEQLASVLDPELFAALFEALRQLPMGTPQETAGLRAVLRQGRRPPRKLAVTYSHRDDRIMRSFAEHLDDAVQQGMIALWNDRWIPAGAEWKQEIDHRFREADIVVPLVSEDFLASTYCMTVEMPLVLERVARGEAALVPVVVRACDWQHTFLGSLQGVEMDRMPLVARGNRATAWRRVVHKILTAQAAAISG